MNLKNSKIENLTKFFLFLTVVFALSSVALAGFVNLWHYFNTPREVIIMIQSPKENQDIPTKEFLTPTTLSFISHTEKELTDYSLTENKLTIKGKVDGMEPRVVLRINGDDDTRRLLNLEFDNNWTYEISTVFDNLKEGKNNYLFEVLAVGNVENILDSKIATITYIPSPVVKESLTIDWLPEPAAFDLPINLKDLFESYKIGKVKSGKYQNNELFILNRAPMEMGFGPRYRVLRDSQNNLTFLVQNSDEIYKEDIDLFTLDETSLIPDLIAPETITEPNKKMTLIKDVYGLQKMFNEYSDLKKLFSDPQVGDVYEASFYKCLLIRLPDGTVQSYHFNLPFISDKQINDRPSAIFVIDVKWNDGQTNADGYTFGELTGCGDGCLSAYSIVSEKDLEPDTRLKLAGTSPLGEKFYEFKNPDDGYLKSLYEDKGTIHAYQDDKLTYDEFIVIHPVVYWQDPFDRWIRFKHQKFMRAAEMCKPVIYLYPEETTIVNVKVDPNGGLTYSEPIYPEGGWEIKASSNGQLIDSSGNEYDYLFWEGLAANYKMPEKGFMVTREEVPNFLEETLARFGLEGQEIVDFMAYWVPVMTEYPYYFITFVPQEIFDLYAPLDVKPTPDTVIRVFMDYEGLNAPREVETFEINTPARYGFTVVEWGGVKH